MLYTVQQKASRSTLAKNNRKIEKRTNEWRRLSDLIFHELFQQVPFNVAVIDRDYNVITANDNFTEYFGNWRGKKCYAVYKKLDEPCTDCPSAEVFKKGKAVVADADRDKGR